MFKTLAWKFYLLLCIKLTSPNREIAVILLLLSTSWTLKMSRKWMVVLIRPFSISIPVGNMVTDSHVQLPWSGK